MNANSPSTRPGGDSSLLVFCQLGLPRALLASALLALACLWLLALTPEPARAAPEACVAGPHSGTISTSQEWCAIDNPHVVDGSITIASGFTLTIESGVEVRFNSGTQLEVQNGGTLVATGTPAQPIGFTANSVSPTPGSWRYFFFHAGSHASLSYCDLGYAGQANGIALYVDSSDVLLSHCSIHDNSGDAIHLRGTGLAPTLANLTIVGNGGRAVYQNTVDMTPAYSNLSASGNGTNAIVSASGNFNRDATLSVAGTTPEGVLPYIWLGPVDVSSGYTLTIDPGVELRFPSGFDLELQFNATLLAEGTPSQPITFTSDLTSPSPGSWRYFFFHAGSHASLSYCDLGYAGQANGIALYVDSSDVSLSHCSIHDNSGDAIHLGGAGLAPTLADLTIADNGGIAVYQNTVDMIPAYSNLNVSGNGTNAIVSASGNFNRDAVLSVVGATAEGVLPYIWLGPVDVSSGYTLTIDPGVELRFPSGFDLELQLNATLLAQGTPTQPITFTANSTSPVPGSWRYFFFHAGSHAFLSYCDLGYAGQSSHPALYVESSEVLLSHCNLHDNLADVIQLLGAGLAPTLADLTIADNGGTAVYQNTVDMTPAYSNLSVSGNGTDAIVSAPGNFSRDATLSVVGSTPEGVLPYIWLGPVDVSSSYSLTIDPGVELRFPSGFDLEIQSSATLLAEGTPTQPITFTANLTAPVPGSWRYFFFHAGSHASLAFCGLGYAGQANGVALYVDSSDVLLSHCSIHDSSGDAIQLRGAGLAPTLADLTIVNNSGRAVYQNTVDMIPAYNNLSVSGNGTNAIVSTAANFSRDATLSVAGTTPEGVLPYIWLGPVDVSSSYTLTIDPGVELRFPSGFDLEIQSNATLLAEGTPTQPITFTTNLTSPVPGSWRYFFFHGGSHASLSYCDLGYAGQLNYPALYVDSSDVQLQSCRIHHNLDEGLEVRANAQPQLRYNRIEDNGFGLRNDTPTTQVDARNNWWGDATGPYHATLNPGGLGNAVSNGVLFDPWLGPYAYLWLEPQKFLLHASELVSWYEFTAGQPAAYSVDILATVGGQSQTLGSELPRVGELTWDTTSYPDGLYELHALFRDSGGQVIADAIKTAAVNNSPAIAWHSGRLAASETWEPSKVHVVEEDLYIPGGSTLTVQAGTIVKFESDVGITVEDGGTLDTPATEAEPIIFTALADDRAGGDTNMDGDHTLPLPGDWQGVTVQGGGVFLWNPNVQLRYLQVTHSGTLPSNETWYGNTLHEIIGNVTVPNGVTLTILPGAVVKFDTPSGSKLGLVVNAGGALLAQGSVAEPIVFTSVRDDAFGGDSNGDGNATSPAAGDWRWLYIEGQATLAHVVVSYGGGTVSGSWDQTGSLRTSGSASLDVVNSVIRDAFFDGILAWGGQVAVTNSVVVGADRGICAHPGSTVTVVNSTVDGNRIGLLLHGGTLAIVNTLATYSLERGFLWDYGPANWNIRYSDFWNPGATNYGGIPDQTGVNGNIAADPRYKDRVGGDYRLDYQSPAIDAADGTLAPETDTMDAPRYDDPRTPNTGIPAPGGAYADIGAYEFVETAESNVDLVVAEVQGPLTALAGEMVTVRWTVTNRGFSSAPAGGRSIESDPGTAVGPWHDTIYLERFGETFLAGEVLVGHGVTLGPGESHTFSAEVRVPGGIVASYRWQVTTNTRGEVFEGQNATNNSSLSAATVALDVPELAVDGPARSQQFAQVGQSHWFKFNPAAGQDILVSLDLDSATGATELYIAQGYMPTRQRFDTSHTEWNAPDVTALAAGTLAQTYYVLAYAQSLPGATNFSIKAQAVDFSLSSVDQTQVGDAGTVTLGIRGGQLEENLTYEIVEPAGMPHAAGDVFFVNSSQVYATFDVTGLPHGLYDIQVRKGAATAALPDALEVVSAVPGAVVVDGTAPDALRPGWSGTIVVDYRNVGNVDAVAPLIMVTLVEPPVLPASTDGSPTQGQDLLATLSTDQPSIGYVCPRCPNCPCYTNPHPIYEHPSNTVVLLGISFQGPAGVLPPGASNRIAVNLYAGRLSGNIWVRTYVVNPRTAAGWNALGSSLRPWFVPQDAWEAIYQNLTGSVGSTVGELNAVLAENATYLSRFGEYNYDVNGLLLFELEQCSLSEITQRYTLGAFGRGGSHPWDVWGEMHQGQLFIHYPTGQIRAFYPTAVQGATGTADYIGLPGDYGTLTWDTSTNAWDLVEADGTHLHLFADPTRLGRFSLDYIEDLSGNRVTLNYSADRVVSVVDSKGDTVTYTYNAQGRISQGTDPVGRVTSYTYDASGEHLTQISNAAGTINLDYVTGQGAPREHALQSIGYPDGTHDFLEYDVQGRLARTYGDGGAQENTFSYDSVGGVTATDALGYSTRARRNRFWLVSELTDPLSRTALLSYDGAYNLAAVTAPAGISSFARYDQQGNPTSSTDPLGNSANMAYTGYGRPTALTDARGNTTQFGYDDAYNLNAITYPSGKAEQFRYDARGNLIRWTNGRGGEITYTYDAHDLLVRKEYDDGSHVDYTYDAHRNLVAITGAVGTTSFSYDVADRLTRVTYPGGRFLEYTYDSGGRRTRMADQDGFVVNYQYDSLGRLAGLTDGSGAPIVTYAYDAVGRLAREDRGNGTYTTYGYDRASQLLHQANYAPGGTVASRFDYTYDDLGRRTSVTTLEGKTTYQYDAAGQLTGVSLPSGRTIEYTYDGAGNRASVIDDGLLTSYSTNNMDQYTSVGSSTFAYDADGNLISRTDGIDGWTYTYDDENRLTAMTTPEGVWSYEYDLMGNRVASIHDGQRTEYLIDPVGWGNVVAEYGDSGSVIAHYTHGLGLTSRVDGGGSSAHYHFDGLANTVQLTDQAGNVLNNYSFLPFGEALSTTQTIPNPFTFVGQFGVADDGEGFYFMRNRWYEPFSGRFTQPDPLGSTAGTNRYAYVANHPTRFVDPNGLQLGVPIQMTPPTGLGGWEWAEWYLNTLGEPVVMRPSGGYPATPMEYDMSRVYSQRSGLVRGENVLRSFYESPRPGWPPEPKTNGLPNLYRFLTRKVVFSIGRGAAVSGGTVAVSVMGAAIVGGYGGYQLHRYLEQNPDATEYWTGLPIKDLVYNPDLVDILSSGWAAWYQFRQGHIVNVGGSHDPNDIVGPGGYGDDRFISGDGTLAYTIHFENVITATAPAQVVTITQQLDPDLDWSTFEFVSFGFGDHSQYIPEGLDAYAERLDFIAALNLYVDVDFELDRDTGQVTWILRSIDPVTGQPTRDPLAGFLPPNQTPPEGIGYVTYLADPRSTLVTGDEIQAQASIVFDTNDPIATNLWTNTIDIDAPTSSVNSLPAASPSTFTVSWTGTDFGAGVDHYDLYFSEDSGAFAPWQTYITTTQAIFVGQGGHSYRFYSVATDGVGHQEAEPLAPDAETRCMHIVYLPLVMRSNQ